MNVTVFTNDEALKEMDKIPFLYMAFEKDDVLLEFGDTRANLGNSRSRLKWVKNLSK